MTLPGFTSPPGDPDAVDAAGAQIAAVAEDLRSRGTDVDQGVDESLSTWKAQRARQFEDSGSALRTTVRSMASQAGRAKGVLQAYANDLRASQGEVADLEAAARKRLSSLDDLPPNDPDTTELTRLVNADVDDLRFQASLARGRASTSASAAVSEFDQLTDAVVPGGSLLSPGDAANRVHDYFDVDGTRQSLLTGTLSVTSAWQASASPGTGLGPLPRDVSTSTFPLDGSRASLLTDMMVDDETWADLVAQETMYDGETNVRYFDFPPDPGSGVIVLDWWIPEDVTGGFLKGDGRGDDYVDPINGMADGEPIDVGDSRIVVVMDLETGRASITQTETCTASAFGTSFCNEPRPISFGPQIVNDSENDITGEGINLDIANQFWLEETDDGYELRFDALNSVTPVGSVDGSISFNRDDEGNYTSTREGDGYPAISVTHYDEDDTTVTVHPNEGLPTVIPGVSWVKDLFTSEEEIMAPGPPGEDWSDDGLV